MSGDFKIHWNSKYQTLNKSEIWAGTLPVTFCQKMFLLSSYPVSACHAYHDFQLAAMDFLPDSWLHDRGMETWNTLQCKIYNRENSHDFITRTFWKLKLLCYSYWRTFCKMWMNEIMETVPYYVTLLLVQFIFVHITNVLDHYQGHPAWGGGEQHCKEESNLESYHTRTDIIHILFLLWLRCPWQWQYLHNLCCIHYYTDIIKKAQSG